MMLPLLEKLRDRNMEFLLKQQQLQPKWLSDTNCRGRRATAAAVAVAAAATASKTSS
jgi:hypothetical protein